METILNYKSCFLSLTTVLSTVGLSRSTYYDQFIDKAKCLKGRSISEFTFRKNGTRVSNQQVVQEIEKELSKEFLDYGYLKMTYLLRDEYDYIINAKKVYRIMKSNGLLNKPTSISNSIKRQWVKDLVPKPELDFSYLEFDIKYFYVHGKKRNALVLTVIDVKSRWVLGQSIAWKIHETHVITLFD